MATDSTNSPEKGVDKENTGNIENQAMRQEQAGEFLDTHRDSAGEGAVRSWQTQKELQELPDRADKIINPETSTHPETSEPVFSDPTEAYVHRFEQSKSPKEATAIMNEVLSAMIDNKIPPNEGAMVIGKGQETIEKFEHPDLPRAV